MSKSWKSKPCKYCRCADWYHGCYWYFPTAFTSGCAGCEGCIGFEPDESAEDIACDPKFQEETIRIATERRDRFVAEHPGVVESLRQYIEERGLTDKLNKMLAEMEEDDE